MFDCIKLEAVLFSSYLILQNKKLFSNNTLTIKKEVRSLYSI